VNNVNIVFDKNDWWTMCFVMADAVSQCIVEFIARDIDSGVGTPEGYFPEWVPKDDDGRFQFEGLSDELYGKAHQEANDAWHLRLLGLAVSLVVEEEHLDNFIELADVVDDIWD